MLETNLSAAIEKLFWKKKRLASFFFIEIQQSQSLMIME